MFATTPIAGAADLDPGVTTTATFDEDMDPASVETAFVVRLDGRRCPATSPATRPPTSRASAWTRSSRCSGSATADAVSAGGAALADDHAWSFTVREHWRVAALLDTEPATSFADSPEIAIDAAGNAIAVWSQWDGTRRCIWANRFAPGAGWGVAEPIEHGDEGYASWPKVAFNANGDAIAVWRARSCAESMVQPCGLQGMCTRSETAQRSSAAGTSNTGSPPMR